MGARETDRDPSLAAERDALAKEVSRLEARSAEEAKLRSEAAEAVREALTDLKAMAAVAGMQPEGAGAPANDPAMEEPHG